MTTNEPNYTEEMKLPTGKTCADCFASKFCIGIGCTTADDTSCDYWPNRFKQRKAPLPPTEGDGDITVHATMWGGM
jgi:hypothetical protein